MSYQEKSPATLGEVRGAMRQHDLIHAPGDETPQWGYFEDACLEEFGLLPYDSGAADISVSERFAIYWKAVARCDYVVAGAYGHVPESWARSEGREGNDHAQNRLNLERILEAASAADGLLELQRKLLDETGTGEMPAWWSEYYQGAINQALHACVDKTVSAVEDLMGDRGISP